MDEKTMLTVIDARLCYLFSECPPDKRNPDEINALVNLMKEYNPDAISQVSELQTQIVHITESRYPDSDTMIAMIAMITYFTILLLFELQK